MRYSGMIEWAAVCRRKIDVALLMGEQQAEAVFFALLALQLRDG